MMTAEGTYAHTFIRAHCTYCTASYFPAFFLFSYSFLIYYPILFLTFTTYSTSPPLTLIHLSLLKLSFLIITFGHFFLRPSPTLYGRCCEKPIQTTRHVPYCTVLLITHTHTHRHTMYHPSHCFWRKEIIWLYLPILTLTVPLWLLLILLLSLFSHSF